MARGWRLVSVTPAGAPKSWMTDPQTGRQVPDPSAGVTEWASAVIETDLDIGRPLAGGTFREVYVGDEFPEGSITDLTTSGVTIIPPVEGPEFTVPIGEGEALRAKPAALSEEQMEGAEAVQEIASRSASPSSSYLADIYDAIASGDISLANELKRRMMLEEETPEWQKPWERAVAPAVIRKKIADSTSIAASALLPWGAPAVSSQSETWNKIAAGGPVPGGAGWEPLPEPETPEEDEAFRRDLLMEESETANEMRRLMAEQELKLEEAQETGIFRPYELYDYEGLE